MDVTYYVGLDLGQSADYTALCIVERGAARREKSTYQVRHLQRFTLGTSYPEIVTRLGRMLEMPELAGQTVSLVVDGTGVGAPVVDLLEEAGLRATVVPVFITGGDTVTRDGNRWRVPKRDLVGVCKVLLQSGQLKFAELPETPTLVKELLNFQVKIDPVTAHDSYSAWREGVHDDMVLALALAVWYAENGPTWWIW